MRKKILNQTCVLIVVSVLLTFLAAGMVMYSKYNEDLKDSVRDSTKYIQDSIEKMGNSYLDTAIGKATSARITLLDPDGNVLFDSLEDPSELSNHSDRPEFIQAEKDGYAETLRYSETLSKQNFYCAVKLKDGDILRIGRTTDSVFSTMLSSSVLLGGLLLLILAAAFVLVRRQTRELIEPINELNLEQPLKEVAYEELRPLLDRVDQQNKQIAKQMEELKEAEAVRREFSANVSHELKTPITSMKVLADSLLAQDEVPAELYKEFMGDIAEEIDRENKIITDLLSLVKMDRKSSDVNIQETNINQLIELILKRLRPIAAKRGIDLVLESFKPVFAEVDETKLTLALSNLVENGIKYNTENGWVHVSLNVDNKYFYVKVEDSGIGIPEESQEHIFERFYRVDKSHSREIGGTGLGLAITRSAVLMHHGAIKVYSKEGEGTTFTVRIPLKYVP